MKIMPTIGLLILFICSAVLATAEPYEFVPQIEFFSEEKWSTFGKNVALCDFDTNTEVDLLVTESSYEDWGRVLIFLNVVEWEGGSYDIAETLPTIIIEGYQTEDHFGRTAISCDFNGDGARDAIMERHWESEPESKLLVYFGSGDWTSGTLITDPEAEADLVIVGNQENDYKSMGISDCQDINGDGYDDIFAGIYPVVIQGGDYASGTVIDLDVTTPLIKFTASNDKYFDGRFLGDINGDGHVDYIFHEEYLYGFEGAIRIWFGPEDYSTPVEITYPDDTPDVLEEGILWDAWLRIMDVGDWNDDGTDDLLLYQSWNSTYGLYRLQPGVVGMEPGHSFTDLMDIYVTISLLLGDLDGDDQLDLLGRDSEFFWDRSAFPQTGSWLLEDYDPQGVHNTIGFYAKTMTDYIDEDEVPDAMFYDYVEQEVQVWLSTRAGDDDDDNDTGDDDTGDDDTGDDDTGDDDTGDDDTGDDDTGDDDTGPDDDDNDDDDDRCCG